MGQYSASRRNWEVDGARIASGLATTNNWAIVGAFGTTTKPSEIMMLLPFTPYFGTRLA